MITIARPLRALAGIASTLAVLAFVASAQAQVDKKTQRTWKAKCAPCHGEDGKGATEQGQRMDVRDMTSPGFWKDASDAKLKAAILDGVKGTSKSGKKQEMDGYKGKLQPADVDALIAYLKTFKK